MFFIQPFLAILPGSQHGKELKVGMRNFGGSAKVPILTLSFLNCRNVFLGGQKLDPQFLHTFLLLS